MLWLLYKWILKPKRETKMKLIEISVSESSKHTPLEWNLLRPCKMQCKICESNNSKPFRLFLILSFVFDIASFLVLSTRQSLRMEISFSHFFELAQELYFEKYLVISKSLGRQKYIHVNVCTYTMFLCGTSSPLHCKVF